MHGVWHGRIIIEHVWIFNDLYFSKKKNENNFYKIYWFSLNTYLKQASTLFFIYFIWIKLKIKNMSILGLPNCFIVNKIKMKCCTYFMNKRFV